MNIDLPSDETSSKDDSVFGGRMDLYEAYWLYVDGVRCVGPVLRQSEASRDDTDRSPLARHYSHFYEKKQEHKQKCSGLPGNLPKYKNHFEQPRGKVRKVPEENLVELGIELDDGDDPIWLPPEYELPSVWENDVESMSRSGLRELVTTLRSENEELRDDVDELQTQLAKVGDSISRYLDLKQSNGAQSAPSSRTCEGCGRTFDSEQAKHGHSSHCNASGTVRRDSSETESEPDTEKLAQLADELPELSEQQSTEGHQDASPEDELENLNHLLRGSL